VDQKYLDWGRKLGIKMELGSLPAEAITARCLFGEARGEPMSDKVKVGAVIRNRVHWHIARPVGAAGWGLVVLKPYQFSWTMDSDPNLLKVLDPLTHELPAVWEVCCQVAEGIVSGAIPDETQGADYYYDRSMDAKPPSWIHDAGMVATVRTDTFRFWRSARVKNWA